MKLFPAALLLVLLITLHHSCALSPIDCNDAEPMAGEVLDLINKGRRDGYLFQLLRVADAHLDKGEFAAVYYLVLDVKESDCQVLSGKHWNDCEPNVSRRPSAMVIGQCKVIATTCWSDNQELRVKDFNCTTSSVYAALANTKDSPVLIDFIEDTYLYRKQADLALEKQKTENSDFVSFRVDQVERVARVRGDERTNYYVDFSVRNCSGHPFPRHFNIFGFCRADFSYNREDLDLETPKDVVINCEIFNLEVSLQPISGVHHPPGHHFHSGEQGHSHAGKPVGPHSHHKPHKSHKAGGPPPEGDRPPFQLECHPCTKRAGGHPQHHNSSEHHPHGHHHHGHHPHGHHHDGQHPHDHHHHRHRPHGHHHHGHRSHGHHCHGPPPHEHHPPGYDFEDDGPCDPAPHRDCVQDQHPPPQHHHHCGHNPPSRHSKEKGSGKRHSPFPRRQNEYVYRLPPLEKGELLPSPEANFPTFPLSNHHPPTSESCPGKFGEFPQLSQFFENEK
ncbi:histidine-rich glycoprotein isoform X1 [Erinaceus europaeus]|uniref:Histidine-rich glycoprotein n=1 Tax=Erinaceus europaeus TaxID=9365 RepID=A0ABM3Y0C6_ERIEU|nr:histidine-rich glycoprotein isoform X1 [Erinaceus europaeus]